ncbi:MAG: alkaline phosphatase family protein [Verrucomicrobiaceae bacterium]|jgi:predicted AlkP superfamily pyrophosphatase or phosphodiesterase|nr:alkaline phosphatase family protein [Verrucomicrobiaceae bacterium]
MKRIAVLNVVGLTKGLLGERMPRTGHFAKGVEVTSFPPAFPAVTTTAQATYLTGRAPGDHGIVGNGWYEREDAEVRFWKQSNHLVHGEKLWEALRREREGFRCAKMFWWYNMYSSADWSVTPRPIYPADGRKIFDVYTHPPGLRDELVGQLGEFPFPSFWGPRAGLPSSQWIADSARWIEKEEEPDLNLVYLPHLDYGLQRWGPDAPEMEAEFEAIDRLVDELISFFVKRGVEIVLLSEYGISKVRKPVHLNRVFRDKGWLQIKNELGLELLDAGASRAFAVADHQVAHVYVRDDSIRNEVRGVLEATEGVAEVRESCFGDGIGGRRAGDFIAVSSPESWFTYYYWMDDMVAPDFARTVDIHRKPGYDPVELHLDPTLSLPGIRIASFLIRKKLGFRALLPVIPLDASLVGGSHGRDDVPEDEQPVLVGPGASSVSSAEKVFNYLRSRCLS